MANQSLIERDHHLEKLEFALAISQTKGDVRRSEVIKNQIEKIGMHFLEPGT